MIHIQGQSFKSYSSVYVPENQDEIQTQLTENPLSESSILPYVQETF